MAARVPPHSVEAEVQLLGAAMLSVAASDYLVASVVPGDFYVPRHQTIAQAIHDLRNVGAGVDSTSVVIQLEASGQLARVGGKTAVLEVMAGCGSAVNFRHYGQLVLDQSARRRLLEEMRAIAEAIYDPQRSTLDLLDMAAGLGQSVPLTHDVPPPPDIWELANTVEKPEWLVPNLLERRERVLLTAPEGYGKSTFLRQLAVHLACGIHPCMAYNTEPCRVLIVDVENSEGQVWRGAERIIRQAASAGRLLEEDRLRVAVKLDGLDLTGRGDASWLLSRVAAAKPDVLVIGPLYKLLGDADPIDEDTARRVARTLDTVRLRYGCALLMEAHSPYGGDGKRPLRPYGASLWSRWPEVGLALLPDKDNRDRCTLVNWRPAREARQWPERWQKGGRWSWSVER